MATKRKSTTKKQKTKLTPAQRLNPPAEGKYITLDRETKDYAMFLDGQLVGYAATYNEAETQLNQVYHDQLVHTPSGLEVERSVVEAVAESLQDLPLPFVAGRVTELEVGALQDAFATALAQPELKTSRWQNALTRAYVHIAADLLAEITPDGSYHWRPDEPGGGTYRVTSSTCQCIAFSKEQPCKHRAAAIVLSFYEQAEPENVEGYTFLYVFRGLSMEKAA